MIIVSDSCQIMKRFHYYPKRLKLAPFYMYQSLPKSTGSLSTKCGDKWLPGNTRISYVKIPSDKLKSLQNVKVWDNLLNLTNIPLKSIITNVGKHLTFNAYHAEQSSCSYFIHENAVGIRNLEKFNRLCFTAFESQRYLYIFVHVSGFWIRSSTTRDRSYFTCDEQIQFLNSRVRVMWPKMHKCARIVYQRSINEQPHRMRCKTSKVKKGLSLWNTSFTETGWLPGTANTQVRFNVRYWLHCHFVFLGLKSF